MLAADRTVREVAIDQLHDATAIYTAEPVVDQLLGLLSWPSGRRRLVDTSCGDGSFLIRALVRYLDSQPEAEAQDIQEVLEGWEIHPGAAGEARTRLAAILVARGWQASPAADLAASVVHIGDFLVEGPSDSQYHAIAGNPPYLRSTNVPAVLRSQYRVTVPVHARADLLHAFLDRCSRALHADGEIALVTADRWLAAQGARRLRAVLGVTLGIAHLERLDARSAFYRPKRRTTGSPPRVHPVCVVLRHPTKASIRLSEAPVFPGVPPRSATELDLPTLGDKAEVRIAPWLGTPGVFLVDAETASRLPASELIPAVVTRDLRGGTLRPPTSFAIRTAPDVRPSSAILQHLLREMPRMCARGRKSIWWLPPEGFHQLDLSEPCLLVPRIARSLRPIRVPAGRLPTNHNLSIVRRGDWSLDRIEEALCSATAQRWFESHASPLEGGFRSVTTRLLRTMPIHGESLRVAGDQGDGAPLCATLSPHRRGFEGGQFAPRDTSQGSLPSVGLR